MPLLGRPLVTFPLAALAALGLPAVVVAKPSTRLPPGVARWDEPEAPHHPRLGIVTALQRAQDDVLVLAADLPLLRAADLAALIDGGPGARWVEGEPLCAVYPRDALPAFLAADPGAPLRATVRGLRPRAVEVDRQRLLNVNTPADLARAEAVLRADAPG